MIILLNKTIHRENRGIPAFSLEYHVFLWYFDCPTENRGQQ